MTGSGRHRVLPRSACGSREGVSAAACSKQQRRPRRGSASSPAMSSVKGSTRITCAKDTSDRRRLSVRKSPRSIARAARAQTVGANAAARLQRRAYLAVAGIADKQTVAARNAKAGERNESRSKLDRSSRLDLAALHFPVKVRPIVKSNTGLTAAASGVLKIQGGEQRRGSGEQTARVRAWTWLDQDVPVQVLCERRSHPPEQSRRNTAN